VIPVDAEWLNQIALDCWMSLDYLQGYFIQSFIQAEQSPSRETQHQLQTQTQGSSIKSTTKDDKNFLPRLRFTNIY